MVRQEECQHRCSPFPLASTISIPILPPAAAAPYSPDPGPVGFRLKCRSVNGPGARWALGPVARPARPHSPGLGPAPARPPAPRVGCCPSAPAPTSREKRVTQGTPAGVSSKPLQDPLYRHEHPRDPSPWNRMAFSGKGSQWARNSHHYVRSLPRESAACLLGAAADPRAASRRPPRPHALPDPSQLLAPGGNRHRSSGFQLLSVYLQGEQICSFPPKNLLPWIPPGFPFPLIRP